MIHRAIHVSRTLAVSGNHVHRITPKITGRRRKVDHFKTPDFAAPVHLFVTPYFLRFFVALRGARFV